MSKRELRWSPWYQAIFAKFMCAEAPRSKRIHCPSPDADQRVPGKPSSVLAGTLPSLALAVAEITGRRTSGPAIATELQAASAAHTEPRSQPLLPPIFNVC